MNKDLRPYDFKKPPKSPNKLYNFLLRTISLSNLKKRGFTLNEYNTQGLKAPYILLSNHGSVVDFMVVRKICHPNRINNVASIETFYDNHPIFIYNRLGVLAKRKFTKDLNLIKNIKYSLDTLKNVFCLYPEARYSFDGTTSFIPESLGKMLKLFKAPVAILILKGNFITFPQWNKREKMIPVEADFKKVFTPEDLKVMSVEEINEKIKKEFQYDDFAWQKENNIIIDHKERAHGLHSLLYQCPHCGKEHKMYSEGTELWCEECGKRWEMTELGEMRALSGETEFTHIPDWYKWERENVRKEVREGRYHFEDDVRLDTLPNKKGYIPQGTAHFVQDGNGITITGTAYGKPFELKKEPLEQESLHVEFEYFRGGDAFEVAVPDETYWMYPLNKRDVLTKLALATEELYFMHQEMLHKKK